MAHDPIHTATVRTHQPIFEQGGQTEMGATTVVITSIQSPTEIVRAIAKGCQERGIGLVVAGDSKSPTTYPLEGARFLSVATQMSSGFSLAKSCPLAHYARKNLGYLEAIRAGSEWIIDTDDDNRPLPGFFAPRSRRHRVKRVAAGGWINVYGYFTESFVWPRGFPLTGVRSDPPDFGSLDTVECDCPIQQGLVDGDPDVDAIYRLIVQLPVTFRADRRLALAGTAWCPFNSQNTTWHRDAFPLLYLPATCSFRLTDIWRSLVAQRIARENGWSLLFHEATATHERNAHDSMVDFAQEVAGYLHNTSIAAALDALPIAPGAGQLGYNLRMVYRRLVELRLLDVHELTLLDTWLADLQALDGPCG
jgi:STELLO glycosyltransferase-like protein